MRDWLVLERARLVKRATVGVLRDEERPQNDMTHTEALTPQDAGRELPAGTSMPPALEPLWRALANLPAARALPAAAAVLDQYEAAGRVLPQIERAVEPTVVETRALCGEDAVCLLELMLDSGASVLLPELIRRLDAGELRVPPYLFPALLERGNSVSPLRPAIRQLIGRSGQRLAAERAQWAYASGSIDTWEGASRVWSDTPPARRRHLLTQLRMTDPDLARDVVLTSWKQESDNVRIQLVQAFESGLSMRDEPFLEGALDDRNQSVRRKAADLLARLPDSRLRARMDGAVASLLAWTPEAKTRITVAPPDEVDEALQRDGVPSPTSGEAARRQSVQISAILGAVTLARWEERWQAGPDEIVQAAQSSRWPRTLMTGWAAAAERQRNQEWAEALLVVSSFSSVTLRTAAVLSPERFDALAAAHADWSQPLNKESRFVQLMRKWPAAWPAAVAERWIEAVCLTVEAQGGHQGPDSAVKGAIKHFSLHAPPSLAPDVQARWLDGLDEASPWSIVLAEAATLLKLRRRVHAAIPEPV